MSLRSIRMTVELAVLPRGVITTDSVSSDGGMEVEAFVEAMWLGSGDAWPLPFSVAMMLALLPLVLLGDICDLGLGGGGGRTLVAILCLFIWGRGLFDGLLWRRIELQKWNAKMKNIVQDVK